MAFDTREGGEGFSEINITPLLDVLIVLLAITLVTGAALAPQALAVALPRAGGTAVPTGGAVAISVDALGGVAVDGALSSFDRLEDDIRSALTARGSTEVILAGDRDVALERAVQVLDAARRAGAEHASIATSGIDGAPPGRKP